MDRSRLQANRDKVVAVANSRAQLWPHPDDGKTAAIRLVTLQYTARCESMRRCNQRATIQRIGAPDRGSVLCGACRHGAMKARLMFLSDRNRVDLPARGCVSSREHQHEDPIEGGRDRTHRALRLVNDIDVERCWCVLEDRDVVVDEQVD